MAPVIDKSISIDEAVKLIEKSNAAHIIITGKKFDTPVKYENQTPRSAAELIKETFDEKIYFRHRMSGTYLVEQNDSGEFMHKINLYFQSKENGANFVEFEIKYAEGNAKQNDDASLDNELADNNTQSINTREKLFWEEYNSLSSPLEEMPNKPLRKPKKSPFYFFKALYNYIIRNSNF